MNTQQFFQWERSTRDTVDFKKIYVDITGDLVAGLVLSEIVYWHLPNNQGDSKLLVKHEGEYWIAVRRYDWWDRIRIAPRQADRALNILMTKKYIIKAVFKFDGEPTTHVRLNYEHFLGQFDHIVNNPLENPFLPNGENEITNTLNPLKSPNGENVVTKNDKTKSPKTTIPVTETTTETTKKKHIASDDAAVETPKKQHAPNPMFDAVALHVFGLQAGQVNGAGSRIGIIAAWLVGKSEKVGTRKIGFIPEPCTDPEQVKQFVQWYRHTLRGASIPRDLAKFSEYWLQWRNSKARPMPSSYVNVLEPLDIKEDLTQGWFRDEMRHE